MYAEERVQGDLAERMRRKQMDGNLLFVLLSAFLTGQAWRGEQRKTEWGRMRNERSVRG